MQPLDPLDYWEVAKELSRAVGKRKGFLVRNDLYQLKELRRAADYELLPTDPAKHDWPQNWKTARDLVSRLLPALRSL